MIELIGLFLKAKDLHILSLTNKSIYFILSNDNYQRTYTNLYFDYDELRKELPYDNWLYRGYLAQKGRLIDVDVNFQNLLDLDYNDVDDVNVICKLKLLWNPIETLDCFIKRVKKGADRVLNISISYLQSGMVGTTNGTAYWISRIWKSDLLHTSTEKYPITIDDYHSIGKIVIRYDNKELNLFDTVDIIECFCDP
jgi:hypothetical protein